MQYAFWIALSGLDQVQPVRCQPLPLPDLGKKASAPGSITYSVCSLGSSPIWFAHSFLQLYFCETQVTPSTKRPLGTVKDHLHSIGKAKSKPLI
jgi:hypothetical protein